MLVLEIVIVAVIVFGVAALTMGHGGSITHFTPDWPGRGLPEDRTLRADDVEQVRFSLAVRGYRMSEVDAALSRLSREIAARDARIEQLTGRPYEAADGDTALMAVAEPEQPPYSDQPLYSDQPPEAPTFADNPYAPPRDAH